MVTLKHLRGFVAVSDTLHFTKAARSLYLSQPALSALISQLENELGVQLIARTTRAVNVTPAGKDFAATARHLLAEFDAAVGGMKGLRAPTRGRVTLAALPSLSGTLLPGVIAEYRKTYPQVEVHVRDLVGDDVIAALLGGSVDFALGHSQSSRDIRAQPLLRDRLIVVCTREFATPDMREMRWRDLADRPIIAMAHGTTIRSLVQSAALARGVTLQIATEVRQLSTALACAAAGVGIAIVPSTGVPDTLSPSLVQLDLVNPIVHRELSLLTHARTKLPPVALALYNAVLTAMTKLPRRRRPRA
jgi:LysR family carnitine catabolism transcriptional activator